MRFAKGLEVALYGGDTQGSVSNVRGCYWVSPLWLILLFRTLGNNHTSLLSCPSPAQIPRKNKTLQNNRQLRWVLHTVPFSLYPFCLNLFTPSLFLSTLSSLLVSLANKPEGRISAVSQVPALALWEGRTLVNGGVVGRRWGNGVCVLGKQGFVGCDCLIPRGLSFHCSSVPYNSTVVRTLASRCSGTRLVSSSPCASRTDGCLSAAHRHERNKCLKSSLSLKMSAVENSV